MVWFFIGVVAKLARRWLCTPVIVGSTPTDSTKFAGVAQTVQERSPGMTEVVSSTLTTGSNFSAKSSGCRVAATHLPWEQVHAGSIPAIQTND